MISGSIRVDMFVESTRSTNITVICRRSPTRSGVVSLPDCSLALALRVGVFNPRKDGLAFARTIQPGAWALRRLRHVPNSAGHYWEIGRPGFTVRALKRRFARHFVVEQSYLNHDWLFSYNFVLRARTS